MVVSLECIQGLAGIVLFQNLNSNSILHLSRPERWRLSGKCFIANMWRGCSRVRNHRVRTCQIFSIELLALGTFLFLIWIFYLLREKRKKVNVAGIIYKHALEIWEALCKAPGLLPPQETDTVLGVNACYFRSEIESERRSAKSRLGMRHKADESVQKALLHLGSFLTPFFPAFRIGFSKVLL